MSSRRDLIARGAKIAESVAPSRGASGDLPAGVLAPRPNAHRDGVARVGGALAIPLDRLRPDPGQPRKEFDEDALARLAASLKDHGQQQPIRVRWEAAANAWVIIAGERRYRAALLAGLATLDAVEVAAPPDAAAILDAQLIENCLREDLKPVEQGRAFKSLMDRRGWSTHQLAAHLHVHQSGVVRALALLALPGEIQEDVDAGLIPARAAVAIARQPDPEAREELADAARSGVPAQDIEARAAGKVRVRAHTRQGRGDEFPVPGGTVTVHMDDPAASPAAVAEALVAALRLARAKTKGAA